MNKLRFTVYAFLMCGLLFGQGGYKGSLTATCATEGGVPLPGAIAILSADTFSRSFVSDANGTVRFVGLVPSTYTLKITSTGFQSINWPNITIDTGQNVKIDVILAPAVDEVIIVPGGGAPILDRTKIGTATVFTEEELTQIPQSRDPWSVVQSVPGIQTDRVNVGGSEAGQQSNFASKGDDGSNTSWVMDGVEFVDPAARGATQSYLDFSSFKQISVTTGGSDVSVRSSGANLNFVTKQGSNNHQGSVRLLYADQDFQASNNDGVFRSDGTPFVGNRIAETFEKSFEIGGPLIKDRLWYWGAFSQNSINQTLITGQSDRTELRNISFKLHGDISATTRFNAFYTEGDKIKIGRDGGVTRPPNTTWDQQGPTPIYMAEISQLVGQSTELQLVFGRVGGGFSFTPQGTDGQIGIDLTNGVFDDTTFITYATSRPVNQYEIRGSTFLSGSSIDHELQYGFQFKDATVSSSTTFGENSLIATHLGRDGNGNIISNGVALYRETNLKADVNYASVTVSDTASIGNWTFKGGLRYDRQQGQNTASFVNANPIAPELLPAVDFQGQDSPFTWESIAPRLGLTYTWGAENQFLARGGYSQFYETLGIGQIVDTNPTVTIYTYHGWDDVNQDGLVALDEISDPIGGSSENLNEIDPNLNPPKTDELLAGFEWSVSTNFTIGMSYTWRERSDIFWRPLKGGITSDDYRRLETGVSGVDAFTGEAYVLDDVFVLTEEGAAKNPTRATLLTNRPGYSEEYNGVEFTATKRLSNRWMLRANFSLQDWRRNVSPEAIQNPSRFWDGRNTDGGDIGIQSAGSGNRANIFFGSSRWTANINGLYQLPWDLSISANINAREGFAWPVGYALQIADDDGFTRFVTAAGAPNSSAFAYQSFDKVRGDDIILADFRLSKTFHMSGRTRVELAAEVFNVFNDNSLLAANLNAHQSTVGQPQEIVSPRVGRFSATVHF